MRDSESDQPGEEFELFTNVEQMKAVFQQQLPQLVDRRWNIIDCQVLWTRYRFKPRRSPGKSSLSVKYRVEVEDPLQHRPEVQMLYARAYREGRSHKKFQQIKSRWPESLRKRALVHLPELDLIIWVFPCDPTLPYLPEVVDPREVKQYLPYDRLPLGLDTPQDITKVVVEVIRYHPEDRCTSRYTLQWGPPNAPKELTLFGKTIKDDRGRDLNQCMQQLWEKSSEDSGSFRMAQPLGYDEAVKIIWQAALPGRPLLDYLNRANYENCLERVAHTLGRLHQSDLALAVKTTPDFHLAAIRDKTARLIQARPFLKQPLVSLLQFLETSPPDLRVIPTKPIHGAFRINQMLEHAGQIGILDFDDFSLGDPLQDVADLMIDLHFCGFAPDLVKLMTSIFYNSYCSHVDWDVPLDRLNWYCVLQCIRRAYRGCRQQRPGLVDSVQPIISLAQKDPMLNEDF